MSTRKALLFFGIERTSNNHLYCEANQDGERTFVEKHTCSSYTVSGNCDRGGYTDWHDIDGDWEASGDEEDNGSVDRTENKSKGEPLNFPPPQRVAPSGGCTRSEYEKSGTIFTFHAERFEFPLCRELKDIQCKIHI